MNYLTKAQTGVEPFEKDYGKFKFLDIKVHSGIHLYTGESLEEELDNGYKALEVRLAWQTKGAEDWVKEYNFPAFGVGYYIGAVGDPEILGKPNALYGFASFAISPRKKMSF